jgi:transglutaminase-like putative cysteine protease
LLRYLSAAALFAAFSGTAAASDKAEVRYGAPAAWVQSAPQPTDAAAPADAPLRFIYADTQLHALPTGMETYSAYRVRILKPEALQMGRIGIMWNPSSGDATVHAVRIIRQGQIIDVLKGTRFQVIQREGALEQSVLTGDLTATLQVPGLQVGDELEVATTIRNRDLTLGDQAFGMYQFPSQGLPGVFRYRLSWPDVEHLSFQSSRDLAVAVPERQGHEQTISYELRDPRGVIVNDDAPGRFNIRRLVEYSSFAGWADVSSRFWPLFANAATLPPNSPLHAEAAKIAATSTDPAVRATAALKLVQENIRYVFVGLNGGNYRPASADETWSRRFGDCKAKTALLLALLRELGINAEAVLVNANGDDGLDERLPSATVFNHVLVRAVIGGKAYWLDGTRLGDSYLDMLPQPGFSWGLPVRQSGGGLEPVKAAPFAHPQFIGVLDLDASVGFDKPAKVSLQHVIRGDDAYSVRTSLAALSTEDADRAVRSYWRQQESWVDADSVAWRYDERRKTLVLSLVGTGKPDWTGNDKGGHDLTIWGAGFNPPDTLRRSKEQDGDAPWLIDFPKFKCWATTIHLPRPGAKHYWAYYADAMDQDIGGVTYWRQAGLRDNVVRTVMSRSVEGREISAQQARAQNDAIPGFNNNMSRVFEAKTKPAVGRETLPFGDGVDWAADDGACIARPRETSGQPQ